MNRMMRTKLALECEPQNLICGKASISQDSILRNINLTEYIFEARSLQEKRNKGISFLSIPSIIYEI